jgi:hypothetical protein
MKSKMLSVSTIALMMLGSAITPQTAIARVFYNNRVPCYFFKDEILEIQEVCQSDGGSWAGGGGHSLKWSDGVITRIKFGVQRRVTHICPSREQVSVDGKCGETYYRSNKTFKRSTSTSEDTMFCVQLDRKSVCWGRFSD